MYFFKLPGSMLSFKLIEERYFYYFINLNPATKNRCYFRIFPERIITTTIFNNVVKTFYMTEIHTIATKRI